MRAMAIVVVMVSCASCFVRVDKTAPSQNSPLDGAAENGVFTLRWTAVGDNGVEGGPVELYRIFVSDTEIAQAALDDATELSGAPAPAAFFWITGEDPDRYGSAE